MKKAILLASTILFKSGLNAQNYTSYFIGNQQDLSTQALGGICLMGGASEDDNAMKWFLEKANGGDIIVLRTSGSDGYNNYMYNSLGVNVNSVETIVCNNEAASNETYIHERIKKAEAIWFAGGNQWTYISYWRNTPIDSLINSAITDRNIVIGGTSAGMAIMGDYYFSAQNGTITSANALQNPFNATLTIDSASFINNNKLQNTITDTHFDNPDRKGRLITFMSRIYNDFNTPSKAIACDEYTAVCIENNGTAKVYGGFPQYDDYAYFVEVNCEIPDPSPETCISGTPLTWSYNNEALKVYKIAGTSNGDNTFNLNNWQNNTGGTWLNWSVNQGVFSEIVGSEPNCTNVTVDLEGNDIQWAYNHEQNLLLIHSDISDLNNCSIMVTNLLGQPVNFIQTNQSKKILIQFRNNSNELLLFNLYNENGIITNLKILQ